jgi:O-antigen ligase
MEASIATALPSSDHNKLLISIWLLSSVVVISTAIILPYLPLLLIAALLFMYIALRNSFFALCLVIVLHFFYIRSTEEISIMELAFGLFSLSILMTWLFRRFFLTDKPLLKNLETYALFAFLGICIVSLIPAILNHVDLMRWLRKMIPLPFYLFILPFQEELKSKKRLQLLIASYMILAFAIAIKNVYFYLMLVQNVEKIWQFLAYRQTANEPILLATFIVSLGLGLHLTKFRHKVICLAISAGFFISLGITFSRGYWLAALLAVLTIFLISGRKEKIKMTLYSAAGLVFTLLIVILMFGQFMDFILDTIVSRFTSIGELAKDISMRDRFMESAKVLSYIKQNPIIGYGLGFEYSYYSPPQLGREMPTDYVHNAYLSFLFKLGIPGLSAIMVFFCKIIYNGIKAIRAIADKHLQGLLIGIVALFISFLPLSITSPQFIQKDSILIIAIGGAIINVLFYNRERFQS